MVVLEVATWQQVFSEVEKMCAGDLIDAIRIIYEGELTGRNLSRLFPVRSQIDRQSLAENLPHMYPPFTSFVLERGDDEVIGDNLTLRVLLIKASGHLSR